jgi:hypothetical protein
LPCSHLRLVGWPSLFLEKVEAAPDKCASCDSLSRRQHTWTLKLIDRLEMHPPQKHQPQKHQPGSPSTSEMDSCTSVLYSQHCALSTLEQSGDSIRTIHRMTHIETGWVIGAIDSKVRKSQAPSQRPSSVELRKCRGTKHLYSNNTINLNTSKNNNSIRGLLPFPRPYTPPSSGPIPGPASWIPPLVLQPMTPGDSKCRVAVVSSLHALS